MDPSLSLGQVWLRGVGAGHAVKVSGHLAGLAEVILVESITQASESPGWSWGAVCVKVTLESIFTLGSFTTIQDTFNPRGRKKNCVSSNSHEHPDKNMKEFFIRSIHIDVAG